MIEDRGILVTEPARCYLNCINSWLQWYIAVVRNHFFGKNSGKPKPIRTKFYTETSTQVARCPANYRRPAPNGSKVAAKNRILLTSCHQKKVSFHALSAAADFREIWTQNVNRCGHEFFRNRSAKFSDKLGSAMLDVVMYFRRRSGNYKNLSKCIR